MRLSTLAAHFSRQFLALAVLVAGGCGGSEPAAKSAGDELTDADSALAELNRAEGEITALLGPVGGGEALAGPQATAAPAATPADSAPGVTQAAEPVAKSAPLADSPATDPCSIACRALASMERAANHLCGLSGEGDPTCTSARGRVKSAADRVSARCPCSR